MFTETYMPTDNPRAVSNIILYAVLLGEIKERGNICVE